ncbi:MAG: hypothetical protein Q8916_00105 [Bacteroidota bacterium]|nr:hypothetical protein [Bacteroidota bacterium]
MNYFFQLLASLDESEISMLDLARYTPTERKIYLFLRDRIGTAEDPAEEATSSLAISHNTYYKNCSLLLRKAYETIEPRGGLDLLHFLMKKKFLVAAGMRELAKIERTDVPEMTPKEKENFYFAVFHLLRSVEKIEIPMADFRKYGKKWLASRVEPDADDPVAIKIYLEQRQFTKDLRQTTKRFSENYVGKYLALLKGYEKALSKSKNAFAHFNLHTAYYNYYYNTHSTPECMKPHLKALLHWLPKEIEKVFPWVRPARELDEGTIYAMTGEYEKAFEFYTSHFNDGIAQHVSIRVPKDYCISALYTDHHETAEKLIYRIHKKDIEKPLENSRTSVAAEMWLAFLYLNWAKYELVIPHLSNALRRNRKGSYSRYNESILRALEICFYFLTKDWDYTEQLITRNRQWLRRNEFRDPNSEEVVFNDIAKGYLDQMFEGKAPNKDLEQKKNELFRTEVSGLIGKFLDKMKVLAASSK